MFILLLFVITSFIPPSLGFTLDPAMEDGVYEINFQIQTYYQSDSRHRNTMAYYDPSIFANRSFTSKIPDHTTSFPVSHYDCKVIDPQFRSGGDHLYSDEEARAARDLLANWCELFQPHDKGGVVVAVVGNSAWYMCNWDFKLLEWGEQHCSRKEVLWAEEVIDGLCGRKYVGHLHIHDWLKDYGRVVHPGSICGGIQDWPPRWPAQTYWDIIRGMKKIKEAPEGPHGNSFPEECKVLCEEDDKCYKKCKLQEEKQQKEAAERKKKYGEVNGLIREEELGS